MFYCINNIFSTASYIKNIMLPYIIYIQNVLYFVVTASASIQATKEEGDAAAALCP